ncbi:MAG: DUF4342 domain-containing protein, partial [Ktedonobacteraceae bacterium]|nr:DUF4342 domain-containing protein [Ktedonobacteraceae bacterium]
LEIPLSIGVAGVVLAPVWAAIGVLGALIAQCSIEVVRSDSPVEGVKDAVQTTYDNITPPENPASY